MGFLFQSYCSARRTFEQKNLSTLSEDSGLRKGKGAFFPPSPLPDEAVMDNRSEAKTRCVFHVGSSLTHILGIEIVSIVVEFGGVPLG
jgi:hypothetical protein